MAAARLVRDVMLRDGTTLRLRAPTPEEVDDLQAFFQALSPESRYRRFHGFGRTDAAARAAAEADGDDRVTLVGRHGGRVVAVAGYDRLREPEVAEVAFTVADDFQGRGTATRLLEQLARIAAERGVRRFDAEVMADNRAMLHVFERAGFDLRRRSDFGEISVSFDIAPGEAVVARTDARDHAAAVASLRHVLAPASVAVAGASDSLGAAVVANLEAAGFRGPVHAVDDAGGLAEAAPAPELVVLALPASEAVPAAAIAVSAGARALVVLSAGWADAGPDGARLEDELLDVVRSGGLRMVGPNCLGVLNTDEAVRLNATFAGSPVPAGRLAICSQSGAIGIGLLGHAAARGLGVSSFASLGNRADVSTNDLLELWEEDERTAAVLLYLETFGNPEHFMRIARRVARRKPILAVKGRDRGAGAAEAQSETAAALPPDAIADALLRDAGVLRFRGGEELFNAARFFERQPLPRGARVGIVSNSAGVARLVADACSARDLDAVEPPGLLGIHAGADDYGRAVGDLVASDAVDAVIAYCVDLAGGRPRAVLDAVSAAASRQSKPVVASVVDADGHLVPDGPGDVPNFAFPDACADVLARAVERRRWLSRPLGVRPAYDDADPASARALVDARLASAGEGWLPAAEAGALLETHGIAVEPWAACGDADAAVRAARDVGGPVALKAAPAPPAHAWDADAILLGIEGDEAVRAAWAELERRVAAAGHAWRGATVQALAPPGVDVLVGIVTDAGLGRVMAAGLGGRAAGLATDVAVRPLPETDVDARELVAASSSLARSVAGLRGRPPVDAEALTDLLLRCSALARALPEVVEGDLNPVRCTAHGCRVLDLRLRVRHPQAPDRVKTW